MKSRISVLIVVLLILFNGLSGAASRFVSEEELRTGAERSLNHALDLWREGSYGQLYDMSRGGRETREGFSRRLAAAPVKPACCWQKMQDVSVRLEGDSAAVVRAKLGFEGRGETEFRTGSFRLVRDDDTWFVSRSEIFSLAGSGKKKKTGRSRN